MDGRRGRIAGGFNVGGEGEKAGKNDIQVSGLNSWLDSSSIFWDGEDWGEDDVFPLGHLSLKHPVEHWKLVNC